MCLHSRVCAPGGFIDVLWNITLQAPSRFLVLLDDIIAAVDAAVTQRGLMLFAGQG